MLFTVFTIYMTLWLQQSVTSMALSLNRQFRMRVHCGAAIDSTVAVARLLSGPLYDCSSNREQAFNRGRCCLGRYFLTRHVGQGNFLPMVMPRKLLDCLVWLVSWGTSCSRHCKWQTEAVMHDLMLSFRKYAAWHIRPFCSAWWTPRFVPKSLWSKSNVQKHQIESNLQLQAVKLNLFGPESNHNVPQIVI